MVAEEVRAEKLKAKALNAEELTVEEIKWEILEKACGIVMNIAITR